MVAMLLRTASTFQAEAGIFAALDALSLSSNVPKFFAVLYILCFYLIKRSSLQGQQLMTVEQPSHVLSALCSNIFILNSILKSRALVDTNRFVAPHIPRYALTGRLINVFLVQNFWLAVDIAGLTIVQLRQQVQPLPKSVL
jgi:hypothetical protein